MQSAAKGEEKERKDAYFGHVDLGGADDLGSFGIDP